MNSIRLNEMQMQSIGLTIQNLPPQKTDKNSAVVSNLRLNYRELHRC
jgi:hypothetical protein